MNPVAIICRAIVAGGLAGARPALTLLLVQLAVAFLTDGSSVPTGLEWLVHHYAIIAVAALSIVEHFARTDPDLDEMLEIPSAIIGIIVAATIPMLLPALDGTAPSDGTEQPSQPPATQNAGMPDGLFGMEGLQLVAAILAAMLLFWVRRKLLRVFGNLSLSQRYYRWAESGVIVGAMAVIVLIPLLTIALAALVVLGSTAIGATIFVIQRHRDDEARRACPSCDAKIRKEATLCPKCGAEIEPVRKMGQIRPKESKRE